MRPSFELRSRETYLDNAATTMVDPGVVEAMMSYLEERFGNPETSYHLGVEAMRAVDESREKVMGLLGDPPGEVCFTSGGTESNNWALKGFRASEGARIAVSAVEHGSVLDPARWLAATRGVELVELPVDQDGVVSLDALDEELERGLVLVSVQHANNETGVLQPVAEIGERLRDRLCFLHVDASQTFGKMEFDPREMGVDLMTLSAHKMHGPMGVGALYVGPEVGIDPLLHGGGQQGGMRAGTIPVQQVVGFGVACDMAWSSLRASRAKWEGMRREVEGLAALGGVTVNGGGAERLPNIVSLTFDGAEAALVAAILDDRYGICVGTGAACSRGASSHVLEAMGRTRAQRASTIRVSFGRHNDADDAGVFSAAAQAAVEEARRRDLMT